MDLHPKQFVRVNVRSIRSEGVDTIVERHFSVDPRTITLDRLRHLVARALDVRGEFCLTCLRSEGCGDAVPLSCDWDLEGALAEESRIDLTLELQPLEPGLEEWDIICPGDVPVAGHEASCTPRPRKGSILEQVLQLCTPNPVSNGRLPLTESEFASLADWPCPLRYAVYRAGGAEPNLRPALWMHLLDVYPTGAGHKEREEFLNRKAEEYYGLRHGWQKLVQAGTIPAVLRDVTCLVRKDVRRTDRLLDLDERALYNVLTTYAVHHPSVGYCQGMSDLLSPMLHVMKTEARAYVAFCGLMQRMRDNFRRDGRSVRTKFRHLRRALRTHDPPLHEHLARCGALNLLFCYRWLLLDLKREFPYKEMLRLMEVLWSTLRPAHREKGVELYEVRFPTTDVCESLRVDPGDEEHPFTEEDAKPQRRRKTVGRCPSSDEPKRRSTRNECRSVRRTTTAGEHDSHRTRTDHSEVPQRRTTDEYPLEEAGRTTITDEHDSEDSQRTRDGSEASQRKTTPDEFDSERGETGNNCRLEGAGKTTTESTEHKQDGIGEGLSSGRTTSRPTSVSLKRWAMLSRRQSIAQNIESEDCSSSSTDDKDSNEDDDDNNDCHHAGDTQVFRPRRRRRRCRSWETATRPKQRQKEDDETFPASHPTIHEMPLVDDWLEQSAERRRHGSSDSNYGSNFSDEDEDTSPSSARSRSEGYDSEHGTLTDHSSCSTSSDDDYDDGDSNHFTKSVDSADTYHNNSQNLQRPPRLLPGPTRFGDGKPFLVFLCLTMLTNHREAILRDDMDASEIGIYFDRLVRGHRLCDVLPGAQQLFAEYLRTGWTEDD